MINNILYNGTPYKGHQWIKDTSLQGTLFLSHFDTLLCSMTPQQRTPLLKGQFAGPNGVRYREVSLYLRKYIGSAM